MSSCGDTVVTPSLPSMPSSGSNETYLEALVEECLTPLPYQLKRSLELLQDLNRSCTADCERLRHQHAEYLAVVEEAILGGVDVTTKDEVAGIKLPAITLAGKSKKKPRYGAEDRNYDIIRPTTDEWIEYAYQAVAAQQKLQEQQKIPPHPHSVMNQPLSISRTPDSSEEQPDRYTQILQLQQHCLQKTDEKVSVAQQALDWVNAVSSRISDDLENWPSTPAALLKDDAWRARSTTPVHQNAEPSARAPALAACHVGPEWILAKILHFDAKTRQYKLADEDVESQKSEYGSAVS